MLRRQVSELEELRKENRQLLTSLANMSQRPQISGSAPGTSVSVSNDVTETPAFASWGATKDEILVKVAKMQARVLTNTENVIVTEIGPEGITNSDGTPLTQPIRMEYFFEDGKLAHSKSF